MVVTPRAQHINLNQSVAGAEDSLETGEARRSTRSDGPRRTDAVALRE